MKKLLVALVLVLMASSVAFAAESKKMVVGVTPFPHKDIIAIAAKLLEKDGYTVEIKEFSDYVQPNVALAEGSLFANFYQHEPYLDNMVKEKKMDIVSVAKVHIEPLGFYSNKIKTLDELKAGDKVAVPNDPTNGARALRLLEVHGLLTLKDGELVAAKDITANPKKLEIIELEAALLPRTLVDVTAAVINTNFATEAGLIPSRDAIVIEPKESPYANILVVRKADKDSEMTRALINAVQSPEVKDFIVKELEPKGIVPAF